MLLPKGHFLAAAKLCGAESKRSLREVAQKIIGHGAFEFASSAQAGPR
jgi:hypothetical protein